SMAASAWPSPSSPRISPTITDFGAAGVRKNSRPCAPQGPTGGTALARGPPTPTFPGMETLKKTAHFMLAALAFTACQKNDAEKRRVDEVKTEAKDVKDRAEKRADEAKEAIDRRLEATKEAADHKVDDVKERVRGRDDNAPDSDRWRTNWDRF